MLRLQYESDSIPGAWRLHCINVGANAPETYFSGEMFARVSGSQYSS